MEEAVRVVESVLAEETRTPRPQTPVIETRELAKHYRKDGKTSKVLGAVDLTLGSGRFGTIIGPSGCGKSTILRILSGLVGFDGGSVSVLGEPVRAPRADVAFMFQGLALLTWRTVLQNVLLPAELGRSSGGSPKERARRCIEMVGLTGFERYRTWEISGGMKQRVALARVLMGDAKVLLLDEPLSALDELTRESMDLLFTGICEQAEISALMVTHSVSEAVLMSDRVFVMSRQPATVIATIDVPLARPRSKSTLDEPEFATTVREVRRALEVGS